MKFFGYKKRDTGNGLLEMKEVTISANPEELHEIADFLLRCASDIESSKPHFWNHEHFSPKTIKVGEKTPSLIVHNSKY